MFSKSRLVFKDAYGRLCSLKSCASTLHNIKNLINLSFLMQLVHRPIKKCFLFLTNAYVTSAILSSTQCVSLPIIELG